MKELALLTFTVDATLYLLDNSRMISNIFN